MFSKATGATVSCLSVCLLTLWIAQPVRAGGFGVSVEVPASSSTVAQPGDAVLIVRTMGCHGPGAAVSAKAEGLIDGERVSLPVKLDYAGNDRYTLKHQWPTRGTWLISLHAKSEYKLGTGKQSVRPIANVLVEFAPDGSVKNVNTAQMPRGGEAKPVVRTRYVSDKDKARTINSVLQTLAAQIASPPLALEG